MSDKPFDVKAVNPRYKGAMMSDVARALLLLPVWTRNSGRSG